MKWVKASERLPIKSHNYHVKIWSERHNYFYHDTNHFEHGTFSPVLNTNDKVYEWLDESEPSYTEQDMDDLVEYLLEMKRENREFIMSQRKRGLKFSDILAEMYNKNQ